MTLSANADILIVDDTPANLNVLSAILGKRGYRVRPAINGALALKAAQKAARPKAAKPPVDTTPF